MNNKENTFQNGKIINRFTFQKGYYWIKFKNIITIGEFKGGFFDDGTPDTKYCWDIIADDRQYGDNDIIILEKIKDLSKETLIAHEL